jgi:hypothetical protein
MSASVLKSKLEKAVQSDSGSEEIKDLLVALSKVEWTFEMLKTSKAAAAVAKVLAMKGMPEDVTSSAMSLCKQWKELVKAAPAERTSSRPKKEVSYAEPSEAELISKAEQDQAERVAKTSASVGKVTIYKERQPVPKRGKDGCFSFADYPAFRPNLSPSEVLKLGSFGGGYFRPIRSKVTGLSYTNEAWEELPKEWLEGVNIKSQLTRASYEASVNKYKVKCGASLDEWEGSGWIRDSDPYGWFQWYCRFFQGRRCDDDERQVARGLQCFGPTGRWRTNLMNKCLATKTGGRTFQQCVDDLKVSPVIRQTLQHWGYSLTAADLESHHKKMYG